MRPYILKEANYKYLQDAKIQLAIIPWGATEAHNYHLPYGTDNYETEAFAAEAAKIAWNRGAKSLVLPGIPFGVNTGQSDIPGTINFYPSTQAVILHDILESLEKFKISKVLILNGHGGNDFKQILREAGNEFTDLFLVCANWYQSVDKTQYFVNEGDHADEMETSLLMYLKPELVLPLDQAGDGKYRSFASKILNENWAWSERKWSKVTQDTGIGNPKEASIEKGRAYFEAVCQKVAQLIEEIIELDKEDPYEA